MRKYSLLALIFIFFISCGRETPNIKPPHPNKFKNLKISNIHYTKTKEKLKVPGTVISLNKAKVYSKVMGEIKAIKVKEGEKIAKGELLIKINDSLYMARYKQALFTQKEIKKYLSAAQKKLKGAKSQFLFAQQTYNRFLQLKEKKVISKQKFDEIKNTYNSAQANYLAAKENVQALISKLKMVEAKVEEAKTYLNYTTILSPFNGIVIEKFVDIGDSVSPGTPLVTIQYENKYQILCSVPETYINFIKEGDILKVKILDKEIKGKINSIVFQGDFKSRTYNVKLNIPTYKEFKPGMFAYVYLPIKELNYILIPKKSIISHGQITGIFTVDTKGVVHYRIIRIGREIGNYVEIISGLRIGDRYVENPPLSLKDGDIVTQGI